LWQHGLGLGWQLRSWGWRHLWLHHRRLLHRLLSGCVPLGCLGLLRLGGCQDMGRILSDLVLQLLKFLIHNIFIIRKISLEPFERAGVIFGLEILLELIKLLVGHLVGQTHTHTHLKRLINMTQQAPFLFERQAAKSYLLQ
jgi:hypothetical protein